MDPFKNIRPYTDAEVAGVLQSLVNNPSVLKALIGFQFPGILAKAPFVKFFIKQKLISQIKTKIIYTFQTIEIFHWMQLCLLSICINLVLGHLTLQ